MSHQLTQSAIQTNLTNGVLTLTLNRPGVRNALTLEMVEHLLHVFDNLDSSQVRVAIIRGAGGNFCAGGDLKDMNQLLQNNSIDEIASYSAQAGRMLQSVYKSKVAVIAAVEGAVMGGGFGLACAADIVIATADAKFGLPESSLGLVPAQIAPYVVKRVGRSYARLLAVSGTVIEARKAQQIGLVHYVVDNDTILDELIAEITARIISCAPQALATTKELVSASSSEMEDPEKLGDIFARAMLSDEATEGIAAFSEKRKPQWVQ